MPNADHDLPDEDLPNSDDSETPDPSKSAADKVADSLGASDVRHDRARNRTVWTAVGIAVAVVVLGGVAYAVARVEGGSKSGSSAQSETSGSGSTSSPAQGSPATGEATSGAASATSGASPTGTQSVSGVAPGPTSAMRPTAPAAPGSILTSLTAPPQKTTAMIVVPKGFSAARYEIVFQPYGWGPGGTRGGRIVVSVQSSKPLDQPAKVLSRDFAKTNAMLFIDPSMVDTLGKGGTYTGVMEVRPQGDVGLLYLVKVTPGG